MGIKHFVFAINKMDLVDFREDIYKSIKKDIKVLLAEFDYKSAELIPVSATEGDNVTTKSPHMPWYKGKHLLEYLEQIDVSEDPSETGFTMPVQRVCRPNLNFRGFQGQIESGQIAVGDEITVLPSREKAVATTIYDGDRKVEQSFAGHAVTIQLDTEIDISRGCVLTKNADAVVNSIFTVTLLWMDDTKLVEGKNYILKVGTQAVPATVMNIRHKIDVNSGEEVFADAIYKNEIALCEITTGSKIVFDEFKNNNALGALILIDRITHATCACGVIEESVSRGTDLTWHNMDITKQFREQQMNQKARTIWFTGLSGAGKSTLANELEKRFAANGNHTMLLDGDNVRLGLNKDLGFTEADRIENIRRIAEVSKLMNDAGLIVLTSFISPYVRDRRQAREIIGNDFIEVYVSTPIEECERRDPKGLYAAARRGEVANFTGVTSQYEVPENPEITIDTSKHSIEECADIVLDELQKLL
jgi:bifunctional enzyme CysN/CysC